MSSESQILKRVPGRKRDEDTRHGILRAAYDLIVEKGFRALTMEDVSDRSRASRSTIYRWWPNKGALATEAYLRELAEETAPDSYGTASEELKANMRTLTHALAGTSGQVLASLLGGARDDPHVLAMCRGMAQGSRRERGRECIRRGIANGEFRPDLDLDAALDALFLPIFVRVLLNLGPCDDEWVDTHASTVMRGMIPNAERAAAEAPR